MSTYRILVDSSQRLIGNTYDFQYDVSRVTTSRDMIGKTWMMGVEWCDPVKYSEYTPTFDKNESHPSCLLLTCTTFGQHNTYDSFTGNISSTLALCQSYCSQGVYGISADTPYLRTKHLGCILQGDRLNQAGTIRFSVKQFDEGLVTPCQQPNGASIFGEEFSFSLVFWEVPAPKPEVPISPYYDFFKLYLSSADRSSGTVDDCLIPVGLSTNGSMNTGRWFLAMESCSLISHNIPPADMSRGLSVLSDTFRDPRNSGGAIGHLGRSYRESEDGFYGLRLTTKPVSRDTVGYPVYKSLDSLSHIHLRLKGSDPFTATNLSEFQICLCFYKHVQS